MPAVVFFCGVWLVVRFIRPVKISLRRLKFAKKFLGFGTMGYMKYALSQSDRLIVSLLLTTDLQAVYGLTKQIQDIGKSLIEGFFDPLLQKVVKYKSDRTKFNRYVKFIVKVNALIVILGVFVLFGIIDQIGYIVEMLGFTRYTHIEYFLIYAVLASFTYLVYKIPGNLVSLFDRPRTLISIDFIGWVVGIVTLIAVSNNSLFEYVYLNRLLTELFLLVTFFILWTMRKDKYLNMRTL
jgi:O-antigen/teichoic acid export membrane protein